MPYKPKGKSKPETEDLEKLNTGRIVKILTRDRKSTGWTYELRWWDSKHKRNFRQALSTQEKSIAKDARDLVEAKVEEHLKDDFFLKSNLRLSEFRSKYLDHCRSKNLSHHTINTASWMLNSLVTFLEDPELLSIGDTDIESYVSAQLKRDRKPRGVVNDLKLFRTAFNWAVKQGWMKENPASKVDPPRIPRQAPRRLSQEQFKRLLSIIEDREDYAIAVILALTGMRITELLTLKWPDIDLDGDLMIIKGKGGHERQVLIGDKVKQVLLDLPKYEESELVFPGVRYHGKNKTVVGQKSYSPLRNKFRGYFEKADIAGRGTFHRFRYTFAGFLGDQGKSAFELKQLLGHTRASTSEIYTLVGGDVLRRTVDGLNDEIGKLIEESSSKFRPK